MGIFEVNVRSRNNNSVGPKSITGYAIEDSEDGSVLVSVDGMRACIATNIAVNAGDALEIAIQGRSMLVTGVVGRGDEEREEREKTRSDLDYVAIMTDVDIWDDEKDNDIEKPSKIAQIAKAYYKSGRWSLNRINKLLEAEKITEEEYKWIVGENNS